TFLAVCLWDVASFSLKDALKLFKRDFNYGIKALWGALFLDSSTKVDVLMLGAFTDARTTGIYTFISLASDLFLQFMTMVRSWVNPKVTRTYMDRDRPMFREFLKEQALQSYAVGTGFMALVCVGFVVSAFAIPEYAAYRAGLPSLLVLSFFLCLCAGFFPLLQVFGQIGRPMTQSATYAILFISNVLLNLLLIPWLGMIGAALGTGLAYMVYVLVFLRLIGRQV
ncbi:MAG: polysaccharide biosynthesis C-terminal domain-containing protein, partial [Flavobacteriales bacterium]|nr:polysaccharide biosynthesis C-terminal domain-containing protein [Flavobacteriales bacterium]